VAEIFDVRGIGSLAGRRGLIEVLNGASDLSNFIALFSSLTLTFECVTLLMMMIMYS
jgi:hypothetical protein